MHRSAALLVLASLVAAALGGCGGARHSSQVAVLRRGHAIFDRSCAGCHTLTGHAGSAPGGDLGSVRLSVRDLASFARIMPVRPRLSEADVEAVAEYVDAVAGSSR